MKSIKELKQEQYDLKAKLHEVIEFMNGEHYFALSPREKGLLGQQRMGMEIYLNALTNRIYGEDNYSFDMSSAVLPLMAGLFSSPIWGSPVKDIEEPQEKKELRTVRCS